MKWYSLFLSFCVGFTEEAKQKGRGRAWDYDWQFVVQPISSVKKGREGGIEGRNEETSRSVKIGEGRTRRSEKGEREERREAEMAKW